MGVANVHMRRRSVVALVVCPLLVGGLITSWFLGAFTGVAAHAAATVVSTPPAWIDNTGQTDVTDALNTWIATATADGTADDPTVIDLDGTYRIEYGLTIGTKGHDVAHPGLAAYTRNHVIFDLTHATLLQTSARTYKVNGVVVEPRKRWGVPLIRLVGDTDVEIRGGHLTSTDVSGVYSAAREPWAGVAISGGVSGLRMVNMDIDQVWGDFVYVSGVPWPKDVLIDGGHFARNGRQGITFNTANGLEIRNVDFTNVQRVLFDHEPIASGGATNVYIHDNTGNTGGLGYMNLRPGANTPLGNVRVEHNHIVAGHLHVVASAGPSTTPRVGFTFIGNTTDTTAEYSGGYLGGDPLIFVPGLWDHVTVTGNHDHGTARAIAVSVSPSATNVTTSPNDFIGFSSFAPVITRVSPGYGSASGGTAVTVTGANFAGAIRVDFGDRPAPGFTVVSETSITTVAPPGTGVVDITVTSPRGTSATSAADQFTYRPVITGITPTAGSAGGNTSVTINGFNLLGVTEVDFGTEAASSFTINATGTAVFATSPPARSPGVHTVDVTVRGPGGTSPTTPKAAFTYAAPVITSIAPSSGSGGGNTPVTITGRYLYGATGVFFGGLAATGFTAAASGGSIVAITPPDAGTGVHAVEVRVSTSAGSAAVPAAFTYALPIVGSISPASGRRAGGTTVVITGANLYGASSVRFGTVEATITSMTRTALRVITPPGTGTVDVTVTTSSGASAATASARYTYT